MVGIVLKTGPPIPLKFSQIEISLTEKTKIQEHVARLKVLAWLFFLFFFFVGLKGTNRLSLSVSTIILLIPINLSILSAIPTILSVRSYRCFPPQTSFLHPITRANTNHKNIRFRHFCRRKLFSIRTHYLLKMI